ncbi:hypothetical protein [Pontimicrobium sp. SW4]|uniref:Glycosyltransferase family 1 protein n=1 Tax=Pontimicrobium sp. SW4 TaxID=3153519 RepID=A0AAU7BS80_9FLAO
MNLVIIPFHDWRKSEKEGFRTRDVHLIKALSKNSNVDKLLVVNRPSTWFEFIYKRKTKTMKGTVVLKKEKFSLTKVDSNIYVTDYFSSDVFGQIFKKHLWFVDKYVDNKYLDFIKLSCNTLGIEKFSLISQNIFSYKLALRLNCNKKLFDAWDNFLKFPAYKKINTKLEAGYGALAENILNWSTNSNENVNFFKSKFNVKNIILIKNGVKTNFINNNELPQDLKEIKRPIIGFGGKLSYLLDYELINFIVEDNPFLSFVFVGQVLDKTVFNKINKRKNVFFLGDKHYAIYPNYVQNFDICIIPYNINEGQHGGDSIKAYEYLLTGKKVVGTKGNGLLALKEHLYLVNDKFEFSSELKSTKNLKPIININDHSWESKANVLVKTLNEQFTHD